jgi:transposase
MAQPPPITSPYAPDVAEVRAWLERMVAALKLTELVMAVLSLIMRMRDINTELMRQVAHLRRTRPRSETLDRLERQLVLPLLVVPSAGTSTQKTDGDKPERKRTSRRGGGRRAAPAHFPRVPQPNPVPAEMRICPRCGATMNTVGHDTCEKIDVEPARFIVTVIRSETVACPNDHTIVSAPTPPSIVEGGKLGDRLIVEAVADKYIEHMPIERQCQRFAYVGVEISPATLGRSVGAALDLLMPVAKLIHQQTRGQGLLATDATGIPVLDPSVTSGIRTGAIWCWTNARWVSFVYSPSANSDSVKRFLLGIDDADAELPSDADQRLAFCRSVQCDGTNVTSFLERAGGKRPGCWAHGRRRLVDCARSGDAIAREGLRIISELFAVERISTIAGDNGEQRRARRLEHSVPVLERIRGWLDEQRALAPPKTPLGRALRYLYRQWHRLLLFLEDGNIELTNNRRERELRRLVLGRRNWLFTWLDHGAERTSAILTIVGTCIAHDVNPRAYLHLVTKLIVHGWQQSKLRDLLPDRMLAAHPELYVGDPIALPPPADAPSLPAPG